MKIDVQNKKGLTTILSIIIDKKTIQEKLEKKLSELQSEVSLKGFRPGKVPPAVIKSQFGKAIYGEVIDKILQESSNKALKEKKIKAAGQPRIDLKSFGEGKDLNYTIEVDSLPEVTLASFDKYSANEYLVKIESKLVNEKIEEIAKNNKTFSDKGEKSEKGDLVIFDYSATINDEKFEGSEGKNTRLEIGKELFLKGFDVKLIGVKKEESKIIEVNLPENYPNKELANKKAKFKCKIINVQKANETKIDDVFAKNMGAKDLTDLKSLIEKQISTQYKQALDSITKKEILDQIEKLHKIQLPKNLVEQEIHLMTHKLKKEDIDKHKTKNLNIAESRIKLGLILNEYGEKNNLKVLDEEIQGEIQKQIKGMPGQEKMVLDYYQKNPSAAQSLKGALYEEKILSLFKSKINLKKKNISITEAEKIISDFNKLTKNQRSHENYDHEGETTNDKENKTDKSSSKVKKKTKKVSKK
ncbi:MAG: trigger factor [Pelagibacteraceae bacterium]|jgi:trigger factor|nr:trigger factor [Pelagibacteraceae bacterium]